MYKANIVSKTELEDGRVQMEVEFTDGVKSSTRTVIPQDIDGLAQYINGELKALNFTAYAAEEIAIGEFVKPASIVEPAVQAKADWYKKVNQLTKLKTLLVDNGVFTEEELDIPKLRQDIKNEFSVDFLTGI